MLMKYLSVKPESSAGNKRKHLKLVTADAFLKGTLTAREILERTDKWFCIKLKIICTTKEAMEQRNSLQKRKQTVPTIHPRGDEYTDY